MSSSTAGQVTVEEDRLAALERRVEQLEEETQRKDERIAALENELQSRPKIRMDGDEVTDITFGDKTSGTFVPIGKLVARNHRKLDDVDERVFDLERGEVTVSDVLDAGATDSELQISRWRADVEDADHPDHVSGLTKNQARSTELWRYFPKLSEDVHGDKRLTRRDATKIFRSLSDYDLPTDRNTVNRCMRFMARATGPTDDEENDDHLVTFQPGDEGSQSVLVADQDEWETFAAKVAGVEKPNREDDIDLTANPDAAETGGESSTADDATENVAEDLDAITDAPAVTTDAEDTVTTDSGIEGSTADSREL